MTMNLRQRLASVFERISPQHRLQPAPDTPPVTVLQVPDRVLERAIDGTDPKIRMVPGHRRRLQRAIGTSLGYIEEMIARIPASVDLFSHRFTADPHVNAFFSSPGALQETLRHSPELRDYLHHNLAGQRDSCWALLCMRMHERRILGMDLSGDRVRRDVPQTAVSFDDHQFLSPAETEQEAREGLKQCLFQGLISSALGELTALRARRRRIATRLRMVQGRLRERHHHSTPPLPDRESGATTWMELENEASRLTQELHKVGLPTPKACLQRVESTFLHPERFVRIEHLSLRLDKMGIRVTDDFQGPCNELELAEARITDQPPRIIVLARLSTCDIDDLVPGIRRVQSHDRIN